MSIHHLCHYYCGGTGCTAPPRPPIKHRYIEVIYKDGLQCICEPCELDSVTEDKDNVVSIADVLMTEAEFEALPEFEA